MRHRHLTAAFLGAAVLFTPLPVAEARPVPARVAAETEKLAGQLDTLRVRYQKLADLYAARAVKAADPAPYQQVAQRFTVYAARATTLRAELRSVRTAAALSKVRMQKIKLHRAAARSLAALAELNRAGAPVSSSAVPGV